VVYYAIQYSFPTLSTGVILRFTSPACPSTLILRSCQVASIGAACLRTMSAIFSLDLIFFGGHQAELSLFLCNQHEGMTSMLPHLSPTSRNSTMANALFACFFGIIYTNSNNNCLPTFLLLMHNTEQRTMELDHNLHIIDSVTRTDPIL
jgi:hypothetical protein